MRDPYDVLGVERSATQDEIKSAFRKAAIQHHPDKNPDDPSAQQRFKEVNAAYQILSDPQKRAAFDRMGAAAFDPTVAAQNPFGGVQFDISDLNIDGIFGDLLGALGIRVGNTGIVQREVRITFEEAAFGCTKEITYDRIEGCTDCGASGAAPGSKTEKCPTCSGRGRVRVQQGMFPIAIERPCSRCHATGKIIVDPCKTCRGVGMVPKPKTVEVHIPEGIENGTVHVVERGGNFIRPDRAPGDLEITIRVQPHELFRRAGDDILCSIPISVALAALGGDIEIPTLEGKGKLRVPPGTQPGTILRLRQRGIPKRIGGRGDLLVEAKVEIPTKLTDEQKALFLQLASTLGETVEPSGEPSFMEKLKNLFS
ncbi:MAG: molecular chaperone DnaJ [Polyangiaceae bacterium]|nr:molecular chaperone DnaJ [Polyangiaceae bacterium]